MPELKLHYFHNNQKDTFHTSEHEIKLGRQGSEPIHQCLSQDKKISRAHARIYYNLSTWWVEDLGSTHGTFLNNASVKTSESLSSGDVLRLGDTLLRVEYNTEETEPGPGTTDALLAADETQPPESISEDQRLEILARISNIVAYSRGQDAILSGVLEQIGDIFPSSKRAAIRRTILLAKDRELLPAAYWPHDRSYVSYTLARQAITSKQAFRWIRQTMPAAESLQDITQALYAPMLFGGKVIGVVALDTTSTEISFSEGELKLLSVIANNIGPALYAGGNEVVDRFPSVFISYSHKDRDFVVHLASDLRRRQVKVWFDERLQSGQEWRKQLALAIQNMDALVFVMSPDSMSSEVVKWEIDTARQGSKTVFPLLYKDCTIPNDIMAIQIINISTKYEQGIGQLAEELHSLDQTQR